jgi:hypothetical protein
MQPRAAIAVEGECVVWDVLAEVAFDDIRAGAEQGQKPYALGLVKSRIPDGGSGVSTPENGEVAGEVSHSKTHGSPVSVLRRYPLAASSSNNGECTDTYGYSHTQTLSA